MNIWNKWGKVRYHGWLYFDSSDPRCNQSQWFIMGNNVKCQTMSNVKLTEIFKLVYLYLYFIQNPPLLLLLLKRKCRVSVDFWFYCWINLDYQIRSDQIGNHLIISWFKNSGMFLFWYFYPPCVCFCGTVSWLFHYFDFDFKITRGTKNVTGPGNWG